MFSNSYMNGDTIALTTDNNFLDTGSVPLAVRNRSEINQNLTHGNLWITTVFGEESLCLKMWPEGHQLKAVGEYIEIDKEGFSQRFDFVFEKVGDDRVIIRKAQDDMKYYTLYDNTLEASTHKKD